MEFKQYFNYKDFKDDVNNLINGYDLTNEVNLQHLKYDLGFMLQEYTEYIKGFKSVIICYENPVYYSTENKYVKKEEIKFGAICDILTHFAITPKDISKITESHLVLNFAQFYIAFNTRHTVKYALSFFDYNTKSELWEIKEIFHAHVYLGERIITELKELLHGEFEKSNDIGKTKPLNAPQKIAVLYEIGIETILNKIPVAEDKYRFIHAIIGGDYTNVRKYMIKGLSKDNHTKAKDFINSKTI